MTAKEAAAHTGLSISTMKRWQCGWCGTDMLSSLMHGCGAIYEPCNPVEKDFKGAIERAKARRKAEAPR